MAKRRGFVLQFCLFLLLTSGAALAQTDVQGHQHMLVLAQAYAEAQETFDTSHYQSLIAGDPKLTKRAFVAALVYSYEAQDSNEAMLARQFAGALAEDISVTLSDPVPLGLMQGINQGQDVQTQLTSYAVAVYPGYGQGGPPPTTPPPTTTSPPTTAASNGPAVYYTDNQFRASAFPPQALELMKPFLTKLTRITLAIAFRHHTMAVQEIDSFELVTTEFKRKVTEAGGSFEGESGKFLSEIQAAVILSGLVTYAEMGLLQEFDEGVEPILKSDPRLNNHLSLYLMAFKVAIRQQQPEQAQKYLRKIQSVVSRGEGELSPVLLYAARTAEYQLARLRGELPQHTVAGGFDQAWSALANYRPLYKMGDDVPWDYGVTATKFWVDELVAAGGASEEKLGVVTVQLVQWLSAAESFTALDAFEEEDLIFHTEEIQGFISFLFGMVDQLVYVLERSPMIRTKSEMTAEGIRELPPMLKESTQVFNGLGLDMQGPGFGPIDMSTGTIVNELEGRLELLEAMVSTAPVKQRAELIQRSLLSIEKTANPPVVVDHLIAVGELSRELGISSLAVKSWKTAIQLAEQFNFVGKSIRASALLAKEYEKQKNWTEASSYAEKANKKLQKAVPLMGDARAITEANEQSQELASITAKAAIASNNPQKALMALTQAQQMKAASVQLKAKKSEPGFAGVKQQEGKVTALTQQVNKLKAMPASATRDKMLQKTQALLASSKSEFLLKSREIRQKHADLYSKALKFDPLNLPDVQRALPPDVAVVQYFPTEEGTYIFLVTKEQFRLRSVETKKRDLERRITEYARRIRRHNDNDKKLATISSDLYQVLVTPVETDIKDKSTIVFIPAGRLNALPFAALIAPDGKPLIEKKMVLELAKPTDFMRIASTKVTPVKSVVAFANATNDLPAAGEEGENIAKLFPDSKLFKGKEANKDNFFAFGGKAEVLHLATHGSSDSHNSLNNYLDLANKEKVAQTEIFELGLEGTSIVTLSACDTAVSDRMDLGYVASLAEAFWIAGSRSVVASLWKVSDESTSLLMGEFYKNLRAGDSKASALRKAQNVVRANPKFEHPYYWASFMLFGDWR